MESLTISDFESNTTSVSMDDKISQLPKHILHRILCFLSQKKAVRTSVLSKSWRYLGSTRPKVEFRQLYPQVHQEADPSVMDEILQRYHDQKLWIQQFIVKINNDDSRIFSLLEKWVPIVVTNMGAETLNLDLQCIGDMNHPCPSFVLPSAVFQAAEFLEELYLCHCKLSRIEPTDKLLLKRLRKVSLIEVCIEDETFEKIMSSCPLIEHLVMDWCMGLRIIRVNNNNLKHFKFRPDSTNMFRPDSTNKNFSIEIGNVQSLETIRVDDCPNLFYHHRLCFTRLKSLRLKRVCLKSFDIFSSNFPGLEELKLDDCSGFQEFKLSSCSIKRLTIKNWTEPIMGTIDAPNILYFKYIPLPQSSISFAATCIHEWESYIHLYDFLGDADNNDDHGGSSSWLYKIHELVKAFSQSKISIHLHQHFEIPNLEKVLLENSTCTELVAVEQLSYTYSSLSIAALTKCMLRIFRPRYIVEYHRLGEDKPIESLSKILVAERGRGTQFWPQDLEDMIMEDIDLDEPNCFPVKIGFRLKWKETKMS